MPSFPLAVLLCWIPVGAYFFRRFPARVAVLANFLGGWALLPGAAYIPTTADFPYWFLGVCLPTNYFLTKATATGLAALAGTLLFRTSDLKQFKPSLCDLPMALFCCVPLLSALTHRNTLHEALAGASYQALGWGVPWLLGRIYFRDFDSLLLAAKAVVISGLGYVPICLVEVVTGPRLYNLLYGYQPYRLVGADRYIGFRPIGLLEDGNQLGIWMAAAALIGVALWAHKLVPGILGVPIGWAAAILVGVTVLCQSAGSIILLLLLLPLALLKRVSLLRVSVILLVAAIITSALGFALFRTINRDSLRDLAERSRVIHTVAGDLSAIGRHSLVWRLARDQSHMRTALQKPLLGYGEWTWWRQGNTRPWSLWMLIFGMYGAVGVVALGGISLLPVMRVAWPPASQAGASHSEASLRLTLVALALMIAADNLLNGDMLLPYLVLFAGMSVPPSHAENTALPAGSHGNLESAPEPEPEYSGSQMILNESK